MPSTPYVVGQWVRAEKFYGREGLIGEILDGGRNWLWILGTRRIGKTSLLKQIEHITERDPHRGYFSLFWDYQGADSADELHMGFNDSLLDAEERLEELGISLDEVEDDDLFRSLGRLRRKIKGKKRKLLLLCDEVEELLKLNKKDPALLRRLRRAMQSSEDIRSVFASTIRLWGLADQQGDTSPFLHGFTPPLYIHNLSDEEAEALIMQSKLPDDSQSTIDETTAAVIRTHCDNHPFLLQLVCKRYMELGNAQEAIDQVATDPMVSYFFSVDFEMLSQTERNILRIIGERSASTSNSIQEDLPGNPDRLSGFLHRLEHLGYVRRDADRRFVLVNHFFKRWFREQPDLKPSPSQASTIADPTGSVTDGGTFDGRYQIRKMAGRGGTGIVYKAYDTMLQVELAIKVLNASHSGNPEALERLRKEIVLSRDVSHPNMVGIYHLGEYENRKYLTMRWIDGETLALRINRAGAFSEAQTISLARQIASALGALHQAKVLHRDIKPHNILLNADEMPFLTDFGLVRLMDSPGSTRSGVFLGTPSYASPEQARMLPLDERSDLYSLGLVIFEMATGRRPFEADSSKRTLEMHIKQSPPSPRGLQPALSEELSALILRCLEKDPTDRFASADELTGELEKLERR